MMSTYSLTASGGISLGALFSRGRAGLCGCRRDGWALGPAFLGMHTEAEQGGGRGREGLQQRIGRAVFGRH